MLNFVRKIFNSIFQSEQIIFPESKLAHKYLDNLIGIEIGGSAHNSFGLNTINVDNYNDFKKAKIAMKNDKFFKLYRKRV